MDTINPLVGAYLSPVSTLNGTEAPTTNESPAASSVAAPPTDTVQISPAAIELAKYSGLASKVVQGSASPERIAALKKAVSDGSYPSPEVTEILLDLVGGALASTI